MSTGLVILGLHIAYLAICIVAGLVALLPNRAKRHPQSMTVFMGLLLGLILFGGGGTIAHWYDMAPAVRAAYLSVIGLAMYALYYGWRAKRRSAQDQN